MSEHEPPPAPDGTQLSPEEWDAVRRLRERSAAEPSVTPAAPAAPAAPLAPEPVTPAAEPVTAAAEPVTPAPEPVVEPEPVSAVPEPAVTTPAEPQPPAEPATETVAEPVARRHVAAAAPGQRAVVPMLAALVVLAVAAVVLAALVGLRVSDHHARNAAATDAVAAATNGVATVLSYNYKSLDADFAKAESLLTPSFRKQYDATTAKGVKPLAEKYKAVSTAQVSAAGTISATASRATVLVFVAQQVTNTQLAQPRLDRSRIQVELVHTHGRWLINKLTPL